MRLKNGNRINGDISLLLLVAVYALFGAIMVYSASCYNAKVQYGDEYFFLKKQLVGYVLGLVAMVACTFFDYRILREKKWIRWVVYLSSLIMLALVFVPGIGVSNYGATRWIGVMGITIQPSEIAKFAFVLFSAGYVAEHPDKVKTALGILPILLSGLAVCALIILEPNMSVTMLTVALIGSILFMSGTKIHVLALLAIPVFIAVPVLIALEPYRLLRLSAFLDPWASPKDEGYQLIQSLYALGNGGWFGVGFLRSRQKYRFLPFAESDFILSVIGEEFGFIGLVLFFLLAGTIAYKGFSIATKADNLFGNILANGITLVFTLQTLLNALVVSGSIPPTGLPLPLISSGNTSLIVTMFFMGILYSVSAHNNRGDLHNIY